MPCYADIIVHVKFVRQDEKIKVECSEEITSDIDNIDAYVPNLDKVVNLNKVIWSSEIKDDVKKGRGKKSAYSNKKGSGYVNRSLHSDLKSCSSDADIGKE
ncbi:27625_t:CDS:2 [Gigaspora margarita]|uniref:27625_t:CDS:1 n=1 Tax=Gigaspora margarita TaxID=4874 RepID=A0ABN7U9K6_GIGMA|nr:27625_t:CDS:2 [Gigaspora margarita]